MTVPSNPDMPLVHLRGDASVRLWGLSTQERLRRQLRLLGATELLSLSRIGPDEPVALLRGDFVYDDRLLRALLRAPDVMLTVTMSDGRVKPVAVHTRASRAELDLSGLDRPGAPVACDAMALTGDPLSFALPVSQANQAAVARRMFERAGSDAGDPLGYGLIRWPARQLTLWLAQRGLQAWPLGIATTALACGLLATGWLIAGLIATALAAVALAADVRFGRLIAAPPGLAGRVSRWLGLSFPLLFYAACATGLQSYPPASGAPIAAAAVLAASHIGEVAVQRAFARQFHMRLRDWRPFDRFIALTGGGWLVDAPVLLAFALAGKPGWGFIAIAARRAAGALIQATRLAQAHAWRRAQWPLESDGGS